MTTFLVAAIQMDTTSNQDQNLSVVADFIGEAAKKAPSLSPFPRPWPIWAAIMRPFQKRFLVGKRQPI
ncbi:hypothetical protein M5E89_02395 [Acidaminococcus intestini]|nr:hypothetical protein M5E89_02395 [Acidaminococcus intestini]